jgi:carbonic anhydrase/acetyltransferase-like protein (isoleucine patch superfamily)
MALSYFPGEALARGFLDRVRVAALSHITGGCTIEDEVAIGARVAGVCDTAVPQEAGRQNDLEPPVLRRCRIGSGAIILGDVEIGAGALVTRKPAGGRRGLRRAGGDPAGSLR